MRSPNLSDQEKTGTLSTKRAPRLVFEGVMTATAFGFASDSFLPHGFCYQWKTTLIWLHVVSDVLIAVAYLVIPVVLLYFAQKRKDLRFRGLFLCFGIFIAACGATHMMEVVTLWVPAYWTSGVIKCLTALAS